MEIGEAAFGQGAHEVQRQRRALVAAQEQRRIRDALFAGEAGAVDEITAIGGETLAIALLRVVGARLGVLARHAADAHHRLLRRVHQHQARLQQDLQLGGDGLGATVVEALGAVSALEQEGLAGRGATQLALQGLDLPGGHEGR